MLEVKNVSVCVCLLLQRCVGCIARTEVCASGPTPAPVQRAGWADFVRSVSDLSSSIARGVQLARSMARS